MARPRSDDKRNAILSAATEVVAREGLSAPTAKIARTANVAEGTLFTYFLSKDALLNELYLTLRAELKDVMMAAYPRSRSVKTKIRHAWQKYLDWGVAYPDKRKVLAQLGVSDRITPHTRAAGALVFSELTALLDESIAGGALRDHPADFVSAIMSALAETTMDFMIRDVARAAQYSESGFDAFWNAIAKH